MRIRRRPATLLLIVAMALLAWSLLLLLTGGFHTSVLGVEVRSTNWRRPGGIGLVALVAFIALHGPRQTWTDFVRNARATDRWIKTVTLPCRLLALGLTIALTVIVWRNSTFVAGGSDSYGYLSQAELWRAGVPIVPQPAMAEVPWPNGPHSFTPLGYRPVEGQPAIVPTYAAGLPLLLAGIQSVAGYSAIFATWPLAAGVLVLASYGLGRALGSPGAGLIAAALMATDVTLFAEATVPMSDVPVAAALAASCYFLFRSAGPAPIRAGLSGAIAVLVRPNLAPTVAILGLWLAMQPALGARVSWRLALRRAALFALTAAPGYIIIALANRALYGSPLLSGYGDLRHIYSLSNLLPNLRAYPPFFAALRAEVVLVGVLAVCLPLRRVWPGVKDRSVFVGIAAFVGSIVLQYLLFEPATNAGYVRYLLPCWPLLLTGTACLLMLAARPGWRAAAIGLIVLILCVRSGMVSGVFTGVGPSSERKYSQAALILREHAKPNSVAFTMQHSGSVRYYGGITTVRYDWIEPAWLDRAVEWFARRGVHSYAVLDDWEAVKFRERFAGQARLSALDAPAFVYQGAVVTHIYDLSASPAEREPTVTVHDTFSGPRIVPPAPQPALHLQPPSTGGR